MLNSESIFGKKDKTPVQPSFPGSLRSSGTQQPAATQPRTPVVPASDSRVSHDSGSKLIVGPNIKLKGVEINDCDTLVVEGRVEATMHSRVIHIADKGAFKGSAEIDVAEIHGEFAGDLTVRQQLVIHSTGKVSGKVRYGRLVIEDGGQISGDVDRHGDGQARASNSPTEMVA